jgi:hypothetical protein
LNGAFSGREVKPWTFPELKKLTGFTQEYGFSASFIAQMALLPGRSKDSISKMMGRHGLGNPVVKERARNAKRLDAGSREEFKAFLLGEGRLLPSVEAARSWGVAQKTVTAYRRRLGIRLSWDEARSSEAFRIEQQKRAEAFVEHTRKRWKEWRERKRALWEKLRREFAQQTEHPPVRVCQACGEELYATREFFHMRQRRLPDRVKVSYSRVCRLCRAERRRKHTEAPATGATAAAYKLPGDQAVAVARA